MGLRMRGCGDGARQNQGTTKWEGSHTQVQKVTGVFRAPKETQTSSWGDEISQGTTNMCDKKGRGKDKTATSEAGKCWKFPSNSSSYVWTKGSLKKGQLTSFGEWARLQFWLGTSRLCHRWNGSFMCFENKILSAHNKNRTNSLVVQVCSVLTFGLYVLLQLSWRIPPLLRVLSFLR